MVRQMGFVAVEIDRALSAKAAPPCCDLGGAADAAFILGVYAESSELVPGKVKRVRATEGKVG